MSELSSQAAVIWHEYLHAVRLALSSLDHDEQEEILDELKNHLVTEAQETEQLVSEAKVRSIIDSLGSPEAIAEGFSVEASGTTKPETLDLVFAYGSLLLFGIGLALPATLVFVLPITAVVSRISLQNQSVRNSPIRWATYPALLTAYTAVVSAVLLWPLIPVLPLAATGGFLQLWLTENTFYFESGSTQYSLLVWSAGFLVTGFWWLVLSRIVKNRVEKVGALFYPFDFPSSTSINRLLLTGGALQFVVATFVIFFQL